MVVSKPAKTAKHTYAERVLQAFSQVRKNHRRHAVHMATLRAQVKKNAQAQRDKLGPQWQNWVTRAVHRLQDEGILAADAPGSVIMTPTGKKAIAVARKSLSIPATSRSTAIEEELIWRTVTHSRSTPSARGVKRSRYSTVPPIQYTHDDSDEDDLQCSPSPPRRTRAKRIRSSVPSGNKSVSQMTKAELKAVLKSLETEHANLLMRATSPLTDLDEEEERERLKSELKARDEELERIRRQLDEVRIQTAPPGTYRSDTDRPSSPLYYGSTPPSPLLVAQKRVSSGGVIRTQSGSLICDVSKRPTPVPSSPGVNETDEEMDADVLGDHGGPASENGSEHHRPMTPSSSPLGTGTHGTRLAAEKGKQISMLENALDTRLLELQKQKGLSAKLSDQILQLIADRDFRVSSLEQEIEALRSMMSSSSLEVVDKDAELKNLHISKETLEASLSVQLYGLEQTVRQHEEEIALLTEEKNKSAKQLDAVQRELQQAEEVLTMYLKRITLSQDDVLRLGTDFRNELTVEQNPDVSLVSKRASLEGAFKKAEEVLNAERESHSMELNEVREILAGRDLEVASLAQELQESVARRNQLVERLKASTSIVAVSKASIEALQAHITSRDATLAEQQLDIVELPESLSHMQKEGCELREKIVSLNRAIGNLRKDYATITANYTEKCDECVSLLVRMEKAEDNVLQHCDALAIARTDVNSLTQNLQQVKASETRWRDDLRRVEASHEKRVQSLSAEVKQLQEGLSEAKSKAITYEWESAENQATIGNLQTQLRAAQMAHDMLQNKLNESAQELCNARENMLAESQKMEAELAAAITRAYEAEEEILDLKSSKRADEKTIDSLKEMFTKLREAQTQSLAELEDKVYSSHSTPVSKRRLTSTAP